MKLQGPLASQIASGKIGNALTFVPNKRGTYGKKYSKPANPRTPKQLTIRALMTFVATEWRNLAPLEKREWTTLGLFNHIAPYHAFVKYNQDAWKNFLSPSKKPKPHRAQLPPSDFDFSANGRVGQVMIRFQETLGPPLWGFYCHRMQTWPFTPGHDNVVFFTNLPTPNRYDYFDGPLEPGRYYYRLARFNADGAFNLHPNGRSALVT